MLKYIHKELYYSAGLISLSIVEQPIFGPPHLHQRSPYHSYFVGALSPEADPLLYVTAVRSLLAHLAEAAGHEPPLPLVLNTNGWIKVTRLKDGRCLV